MAALCNLGNILHDAGISVHASRSAGRDCNRSYNQGEWLVYRRVSSHHDCQPSGHSTSLFGGFILGKILLASNYLALRVDFNGE